MTDEDEPWDEPDMIDSRWTWVAVPFWWAVLGVYWVREKLSGRSMK